MKIDDTGLCFEWISFENRLLENTMMETMKTDSTWDFFFITFSVAKTNFVNLIYKNKYRRFWFRMRFDTIDLSMCSAHQTWYARWWICILITCSNERHSKRFDYIFTESLPHIESLSVLQSVVRFISSSLSFSLSPCMYADASILPIKLDVIASVYSNFDWLNDWFFFFFFSNSQK